MSNPGDKCWCGHTLSEHEWLSAEYPQACGEWVSDELGPDGDYCSCLEFSSESELQK